MKVFRKFLFSSSVALMIFMVSFIPAFGSTGDPSIEPYSIKLDEEY